MTAPVTSDRPRAREDVVFRELDEEWVIFDPATHQLHTLNLSAALVWEQCTGALTVEEIAQAVHQQFADPPDRAIVLADVREALARFRAAGLLA